MKEIKYTDKYPIRGLLQCLTERLVTIEDIEQKFNEYMNEACQKAKAEEKLELLHQLKGYQRAQGHATRHLNDLGIDSY